MHGRESVPHTHKDIAAAANNAVPSPQDDRLADIAQKNLDFVELAASAAREALNKERRSGTVRVENGRDV
jgi:hypothetical protein